MHLNDYVYGVWKAFVNKNPKRLRRIHHKLLREARLSQDHKFFDVAVISYVLSKVVTKTRFWVPRLAAERKKVEHTLQALMRDGEHWEEHVRKLKEAVVNLDDKDRRYLLDVWEKAKVKVAATLHSQGLSLSRAVQYTGTTKQELMSYIGKTMLFERLHDDVSLLQRLKKLEEYVGS
jgi:hypothetical protein